MVDVPYKFTASFFCSTDGREQSDCVVLHGAMANASELSFRPAGIRLAIISPKTGRVMHYAEECRARASVHLGSVSSARACRATSSGRARGIAS